MADLVTTIKVDSKQFDNSIKSSTNQVRQFEKDNHKAGKSVEQFGGKISGIASGALMGMVGTLGLAKGATDIFMGAIRSTQTTSDAFDVTIAQAKLSVEYFFQTLNTGNWSNFFNGITEAVAKAKDLTIALDALSDMKNADQFLQPRDQFEFKKNRAIINDLKSTEEQKAKAVEDNQKIIDSVTERGDAKFKKAKEAQSLAFSNTLKAFTEEDYKELFDEKVILGIVASKLGERNSSGEMEIDLDKEMPYGFKEIDKKDIKNEMFLMDTEKNKALVLDREQFMLDYINREILSGTNQLYIDFEEEVNSLNERIDAGAPTTRQASTLGGTITTPRSADSKAALEERERLLNDGTEYAMAYKVKDKFMENGMEEANALEREAYSTLSYAFDLKNQNLRLEKRVEEIIPNTSIADIDKQIAGLNKKISLSVNDEDRRKLYKQVEELQAKKLEIETKYKAELELPQNSLAAIDKKIKELNQQILLSVNEEERIKLWNDIEELEAKKSDIENGFKLKVELPQGSLAAIDAEINQLNKDIQLAIDTESRQKIYDDIKKLEETKAEIIVSYENEPIAVVEPLTQMQVWNNTMNKIREDNWATIESFNGISMAMSAIGDAAQGTTAEMFKWIATTLSAIGQAIPAITALTAVKEVEAQTSAKAAAAGAASSVAGIPIVGGILAISAIASVVAAMSSIPKFADGGLVYGNTIAQVGEYAGASNNPEVIAPLSKLRKILADTNEGNGIGGQVEFKIAGKDLVGTINNYSSKQRKK